eukprot:226019-Chlamydomonas_euryale.AAC.6
MRLRRLRAPRRRRRHAHTDGCRGTAWQRLSHSLPQRRGGVLASSFGRLRHAAQHKAGLGVSGSSSHVHRVWRQGCSS